MSRTAQHLSLLAAVAVVVFSTNLGGAKLWDRDEPRNAACTFEMLERGDWVTPYFNGELRTHKPILTYWLMMSSYWAFGVNEFAARFWSAALGLVTTLSTYMIGRRLFGSSVGLWGGLAMATALLFAMASRAATPDAPLICFSVVAIMLFVVGTFARRRDPHDLHEPLRLKTPGQHFPSSWPMAAAMYAAMGLAVLAKGPVGLLLPTAVIGMFMLIMRLPQQKENQNPSGDAQRPWTLLEWSLAVALFVGLVASDATLGPMTTFAAAGALVIGWGLWRPASLAGRMIRPFAPQHFLATCWAMRPLTALAVVLAIALPWYVWVGLRTDGAWLEGFFLQHNLGRAMNTMEGHRGTFLFYPVSALGGMFPWSILLPAAVIAAAKRIRQRDPWAVGFVLLLCWVGVYMTMFSLARTKLPSYVTPCYAGLATLIGALIVRWRSAIEPLGRMTTRAAFGSLIAAGLAIAVALPIAAAIFAPGEEWLGLIGAAPIVGGLLGLVYCERRQPALASLSLGVCAVVTAT
ncbi:MAG: glycosyltransferase family 39 protein, partial [Planctomycetales bacterium]|nr:glycosyltransferase family 39 protein [Planctomycetales bacterium]